MRSTITRPDAVIAEPDGSSAVLLDTANDMPRQDVQSNPHSPSYEEIAEAAYLRYLGRGGQHGYDIDDWVDAELSLRKGF